jgi:hypothetical protein
MRLQDADTGGECLPANAAGPEHQMSCRNMDAPWNQVDPLRARKILVAVHYVHVAFPPIADVKYKLPLTPTLIP